MQESLTRNDQEQRRLDNEYRRDVNGKEQKIALEKKILSIRLKEISTEQRLTKSRHLELVKRSRKAILTLNERKK